MQIVGLEPVYSGSDKEYLHRIDYSTLFKGVHKIFNYMGCSTINVLTTYNTALFII